MSVFESIERHPLEYLPTGDKALLIAWAIVPTTVANVTANEVHVVICLEDGTALSAPIEQVKFDYRYDWAHERWVDVSRVTDGPLAVEGSDADADQETGDDGGETVQRLVPDLDPPGESDPVD